MKNLKVISLMLAVVMLMPACKAQDEATEPQHTESTAATEATEPPSEATEPSTEATEPSEAPTEEPTEPDEPTPEPQETVSVVGTYDSVEEVFADYEKRYVTYGSGDSYYETVCSALQRDDSIEDQYIAFVFTDLDNFGFLAHVYRSYSVKNSILLKQVFAFDTLYNINGWYEGSDEIELYGLYNIYGGSTIAVGKEIVAFACERNVVPLLFYDGGYLCPMKDEQYFGNLFYFTEENGEIKYDWEKIEPNVGWGHSFEGWISLIIHECKMNGDSIMRHSGTVVCEGGQLYLKEEQTYTLDEWFKICFYPERGNNDFETTGWEILNRYGFNSIDELLNAYQTMSPEEWYQLLC